MTAADFIARTSKASTNGAGNLWRWFWQDRRSFTGYLMGSCIFINMVTGLRIFSIPEAGLSQIPGLLTALAAFNGAVFGIDMIHSGVQAHAEAKARIAGVNPGPPGSGNV